MAISVHRVSSRNLLYRGEAQLVAYIMMHGICFMQFSTNHILVHVILVKSSGGKFSLYDQNHKQQ